MSSVVEEDRMSDIEIEIEVVPGVWLIHARWAGEGLWFWQCRRCHDSFGPLTTREGAEVGARAHRCRADPATKAAPPGATNAGQGLDPTPSSRRSGTS